MTENTSAAQSPKAPAAKFGGKGLNIAIVVAGLLTVMGLALWFVQLNGGMVQTGMRNLDSWGLYITSFMFFVGLSAGGLIISSIPRAFGMQGFGGISKVAVWTSICCTVLAIAFEMPPKPFIPNARGTDEMMRPPADRPTRNMNRVM